MLIATVIMISMGKIGLLSNGSIASLVALAD
jgi:hypothetical protein